MTDFGERRRILPKTGQTTSYRDGDDGYYEAGWDEAERFKDVGDGTVLDNATGLMWPKDFAGDGANGGNTLNWDDAIDWAQALDFAGYTDWKIPNLFELASTVDFSRTPPFTYAIFDNSPTAKTWTSTTLKPLTTNKYIWDQPASIFTILMKLHDTVNVLAVRKA